MNENESKYLYKLTNKFNKLLWSSFLYYYLHSSICEENIDTASKLGREEKLH